MGSQQGPDPRRIFGDGATRGTVAKIFHPPDEIAGISQGNH